MKKNINKFDINAYWNSRYLNGGNSGKGSYNEEAQHKADLINQFIKDFSIKTVQEYGVGDGNNLKLYQEFDTYCGYDISSIAISRCKEIFTDERYSFTNDKNGIDADAELALSLDVIFHQVNDDDYYDYLHMLFNDKHKYVMIYATNHERNDRVAPHVKHRYFTNDLQSMVCFNNYRLHSLHKGYLEDEGKIMAIYKHY
jgi:hypothetical protein